MQIQSSQQRALLAVNKELVLLCLNIGKSILKYMRKFAEEYPDFQFVQQVVAQIPWSHNAVLMEKIKDQEQRFGICG